MNIKELKLLSKTFPTIQSVTTEITNLRAICNLPKGTEQFMSDLHGEHRAFLHIMNSCSGVIRDKIEMVFGNRLTHAEKRELATLIYYPEQYLARVRDKQPNINEWYAEMLTRLVSVCHAVTHKYSRSKVRKALPKDFAYIIDELLHTAYVDSDRVNYYENIILSIIELDRAEAFIIEMADLIKRMAVDRLHIVGDIYDRGPRADVIMDKLMTHHSVDIQWGNHDVLWMGAAAGSLACIAVAVKNCLQYDMLYMLENAYGISLLPLAIFASETYEYSEVFEPRVKPKHGYQARDEGLYAKMHKAISVIMYKLEGQLVKRNPEFQMSDRAVLENIDYDDMTYVLDGKKYELRDKDFPTIDRNDPSKLTPDEEELMEELRKEFMGSYKLQQHIDFLYYVGSVYKVCNNNLLFHCCIPTNPDGSRMEFEFEGQKYSGKALLDYCDKVARLGFYAPEGSYARDYGRDFLWFLWCGRHSPIFGKDCIKTFERALLTDESTWKEPKNAYYKHYDSEEFVEGILKEFGIDEKGFSHIVNGHIPVKAKADENPCHANGRLIIIDGGFCKAYQKTTGIAGYTMFFTSMALRIVSHEPYTATNDDEMLDSEIFSTCVIEQKAHKRIMIADTDIGRELKAQIDVLSDLLMGYRSGMIKERK